DGAAVRAQQVAEQPPAALAQQRGQPGADLLGLLGGNPAPSAVLAPGGGPPPPPPPPPRAQDPPCPPASPSPLPAPPPARRPPRRTRAPPGRPAPPGTAGAPPPAPSSPPGSRAAPWSPAPRCARRARTAGRPGSARRAGPGWPGPGRSAAAGPRTGPCPARRS